MTAVSSDTRSWPATSDCVPAARRLVREHLAQSVRPDVAEDAELLVSELVANVVLHVGGTVEVTVRSGPEEVRLEVTDSSPVAPQLRLFSRTSSTGRGMRLVQSLAATHGVDVRDGGKTVWARLSTVGAVRGDDELAAGFADVDWLGELALDDDGDGDAHGPSLRSTG